MRRAGSDGPLAAALADDEPGGRRLLRAAGGARRGAARPCSSSRTSTGPTTPPSTCSATRRAASSRSGAVLVLTMRDELDPRHPLHRLLGALTGCPVHRIELVAAVARRGAGAGGRHAAATRPPCTRSRAATRSSSPRRSPRRATRCRPASRTRCSRGCAGWTPTAGRRSSACRWCPRTSRPSWPRCCWGSSMSALPAAELAGVIEERPDGLGFRHELARRAIESSLPVTRVRLLNRAVVEALRVQERPERARLMHHAVAAGDVDTVLAIGPRAAREAARAGAHRQALAHLEAVVPYAARLAPAEQAAVLDDYGWELYNAARFREAVQARAAPRRSSTRASAIRSPRDRASCACRATGSWPARPTRPRSAPSAPCGSSRRRATTRRWRRPRSTRGRSSPWPRTPSRPGPCCAAPAAWRGRRSAWTSPCCA